MALLFGISLGLLLYTYVGFPLGLALLARLLPARRHPADPALRPTVSILLAAHNEERCIAERLQNLAALRYPRERLRVLVGSDGSTDRTAELARASGLAGLEVIELPERRGKAAVLNRLAARTDSEVLAFTDANTLWAPDALERLVQHFADPAAGGVSGRLHLRSASGDTRLEAGYWDLESRLKAWESRLATTIGANGAIYAIRARLFRPLPEDRPLMDDFLIGCRVVEQGHRMLFEPAAEAWEPTTPALELEMRRKRRIFIANFCAVPLLLRLLRPGVPAVLYLSHKLFRWLTPLLLAGLGLSALGLYRTAAGQAALAAGLGAAGGAALYALGLRRPVLALLYYAARLQWELLRGLAVAALTRPAAAWERSART
jgi:cellulose synthase/poly-beta-1,6-N-acetylglucosamine synthase-like glycosyltransferase